MANSFASKPLSIDPSERAMGIWCKPSKVSLLLPLITAIAGVTTIIVQTAMRTGDIEVTTKGACIAIAVAAVIAAIVAVMTVASDADARMQLRIGKKAEKRVRRLRAFLSLIIVIATSLALANAVAVTGLVALATLTGFDVAVAIGETVAHASLVGLVCAIAVPLIEMMFDASINRVFREAHRERKRVAQMKQPPAISAIDGRQPSEGDLVTHGEAEALLVISPVPEGAVGIVSTGAIPIRPFSGKAMGRLAGDEYVSPEPMGIQETLTMARDTMGKVTKGTARHLSTAATSTREAFRKTTSSVAKHLATATSSTKSAVDRAASSAGTAMSSLSTSSASAARDAGSRLATAARGAMGAISEMAHKVGSTFSAGAGRMRSALSEMAAKRNGAIVDKDGGDGHADADEGGGDATSHASEPTMGDDGDDDTGALPPFLATAQERACSITDDEGHDDHDGDGSR